MGLKQNIIYHLLIVGEITTKLLTFGLYMSGQCTESWFCTVFIDRILLDNLSGHELLLPGILTCRGTNTISFGLLNKKDDSQWAPASQNILNDSHDENVWKIFPSNRCNLEVNMRLLGLYDFIGFFNSKSIVFIISHPLYFIFDRIIEGMLYYYYPIIFLFSN